MSKQRMYWLGPVIWILVLSGCRAAQTAQPPSATPVSVPSQIPPSATAAPPTVTFTPVAATTAAPAATATGPAPAATASATPDPAVAVVLAYLDARTRADASAVTSLSCPAWKARAVTEAVSFRSMNARLEEVACTVIGADGAFTLVGCTVKMITTYGGESREWDLSSFVYQTLPADGQWQMCGYH